MTADKIPADYNNINQLEKAYVWQDSDFWCTICFGVYKKKQFVITIYNLQFVKLRDFSTVSVGQILQNECIRILIWQICIWFNSICITIWIDKFFVFLNIKENKWSDYTEWTRIPFRTDVAFCYFLILLT